MIPFKLFETLTFAVGLYNRMGLPFLVEGPPSSGKTTGTKAYCYELGLHPIVVMLSLRQGTEVAGLPFLDNKGDDIVLKPPRWAKICLTMKHCFVCFDEFNTAARTTHDAALRVINEGALDDLVLPIETRFGALQNPLAQTSAGNELSDAMVNRFGHFTTPPDDVGKFTSYLYTCADAAPKTPAADTKKAAEHEARIRNNWPSRFTPNATIIEAFLRRRPELIRVDPNPDNGTQAEIRGFPTRRTWEMLCRAMTSADLHELPFDLATQLPEAFIGLAAAREFMAFRAELDLPDPEQLLDNKIRWTHDPARPDRTRATLLACSNVLVRDGHKNKTAQARAKAMWALLGRVCEDAQDLTFEAIRILYDNQFYDIANEGVMKKMLPVLRAAGLTGV